MSNDQKLYEANQKLCCAVKVHPCIYDRSHQQYQKKEAYDEAWNIISGDCDDTVASCKVRWRNIRTAFVRSVQGTPKKRTPNRTREYYLHEVLQFFIPHILTVVESEKGPESDEAVENTQKNTETEPKEVNVVTPTNDTIDDEATTSADETAGEEPEAKQERSRLSPTKSKVKTFFIKEKPTQIGTFIIGKPSAVQDLNSEQTIATSPIDTEMALETPQLAGKVAVETLELEDDERRFRFRRACKRGLDKTVMKALSKRENRKEPEFKRQRRIKSIIRTPLIGTETVHDKIVHKIVRQHRHRDRKDKRDHIPNKAQLEKHRQIIIPSDLVETQMKSSPAPETASHEEWLRDFQVTKQPPVLVEQPQTKSLASVTVIDQAVQCTPKITTGAGDDEFLDLIKPQMAEMNSRQKLHFKKKVYESLMEVFDSAVDFPDTGEVSLNQSSNAMLESTTSEEMRLIRELVSLVQAAKHTRNLNDSNSPQTVERDTSEEVTEMELDNISETVESTNITSPNTKSTKITISPIAKASTVVKSVNATLPKPISVESFKCSSQPLDPANLPQHIIQRVVKIGDRGGGNLVTQQGDRRRIYRIYPRGSVPKAVQNGGSVHGDVGTFIIPRDLPSSKPSLGRPRNTTTNDVPTGYRQMNVTRGSQIWPNNSTVSSSGTTSSAISRVGGGGNTCFTTPNARRTMITRSKILDKDGNEKQILRRYSICGAGMVELNSASGISSQTVAKSSNAAGGSVVEVHRHGMFRVPANVNNTIITTSTKTSPSATVTSAATTSTALPIPGFNRFISSLASASTVTSSATSSSPIGQDPAVLPSTAKQSLKVDLAKSIAALDEMHKKMRASMASSHNEKISELNTPTSSAEETSAIIAPDNYAAYNVKDEPLDDSF